MTDTTKPVEADASEATAPVSETGDTSMSPETKAEKPKSSTPKPKAQAPVSAPVEAPVATHVVGNGDRDDVVFSRAVPVEKAVTKKSLTMHHVQRRLSDLGYSEAYADLDGQMGALTMSALRKWQKDSGFDETGEFTVESFQTLFDGDPNVNVIIA